VAVNVNVHTDLLLVPQRTQQLTHQIDLRLVVRLTTAPLTVQIAPVTRESVVPLDHSVRIQHRHNLEQEVTPQQLTEIVISQQLSDKPLHYEGRNSLPGMHSSR
jgi:hypothetical protein